MYRKDMHHDGHIYRGSFVYRLESGVVRWIEGSDDHRLYSVDSLGNRSVDYIEVKDRNILDALTDKKGVAAYSVLSKVDELPIASLYSHPDTSDLTTMGYSMETYYKSDQWKVVNGQSPVYNYVYFPKMKNLYLVGWYNPVFIKSINNYKSFYFGTLNSK